MSCWLLLSLLQLKERQKEDHMYDNTEKFITSAYRRKLEEDKKWQESQKLKYVAGVLSLSLRQQRQWCTACHQLPL